MLNSLFVCYRAEKKDGKIADNNIIMQGVPPIASMADIERIQDGICKYIEATGVRILSWQRCEAPTPPRETGG